MNLTRGDLKGWNLQWIIPVGKSYGNLECRMQHMLIEANKNNDDSFRETGVAVRQDTPQHSAHAIA